MNYNSGFARNLRGLAMSSKEWKKVKLSEIAHLNYGKSLTSGIRKIGKVPVYSSSGITGWHDTALVNEDGIVIGRKGNVGSIFYADGPFYCIDTAYYIKKSELKCNIKYFYYLLKTLGLEKLNEDSAVPGLNRDTAHSQQFLYPEKIDAQNRIAEILSALDDKIELNRQTNATLEAIAQAIFKEWFVDFNFPGATGELVESELGLIPEGWRVVQLGEVSDLSWGDTKTTKNSYSSEGYIAYSASGPDGYLPYYDFSRDGIVVSAIGAYSGKTWFAHGYWSCIKNTIRFWSTDDNLSNEYLYLYTSPKGFWPLRGSAQPFISQTDAREKRIIYPGNHLARYFGEVLQPLFQLIRRNDDEAFTLSQTRDSLLPKLMNGEIEV